MERPTLQDIVERQNKTQSAIAKVQRTRELLGTPKLQTGAGVRLNLNQYSGDDYLEKLVEVGEIREAIDIRAVPLLKELNDRLNSQIKRAKLKERIEELYAMGRISDEQYERSKREALQKTAKKRAVSTTEAFNKEVPQVLIDENTRKVTIDGVDYKFLESINWRVFLCLARNTGEEVNGQDLQALIRTISPEKPSAIWAIIGSLRQKFNIAKNEKRLIISSGREKGLSYKLDANVKFAGEPEVPIDAEEANRQLSKGILFGAEEPIDQPEDQLADQEFEIPWVFATRLKLLEYMLDNPNVQEPQIMRTVASGVNRRFRYPTKSYAARQIRKTVDLLYIRNQRNILTTYETEVTEKISHLMKERKFDTLKQVKDHMIARLNLTPEQRAELGVMTLANVEPLSEQEAQVLALTIGAKQEESASAEFMPLPKSILRSFKPDQDKQPEPAYSNTDLAKAIDKIKAIIQSGKLEDIFPKESKRVQDLIVYFTLIESQQLFDFLSKLSPSVKTKVETKEPETIQPPQSQPTQAGETTSGVTEDLAKKKPTMKEKVKAILDQIDAKVESGDISPNIELNSGQINRAFPVLTATHIDRIVGNGYISPRVGRGNKPVYTLRDISILLYLHDIHGGLPPRHLRQLEKILEREYLDRKSSKRKAS